MTTPPVTAGPASRLAAGAGLAALVALGLAAVFPATAVFVVAGATLAFVVAPAGSPARWAAAAMLPVALMLAWGAIVEPRLDGAESQCAEAASPLALSRLGEAAAVIALVALLARRLGSSAHELGLRRPSPPELVLALVAVATVPLASLLLGPILAEPFFGEIRLALAPVALLPAIALAVANGTMEELAYRGALLRWNARLTGFTLALLGQGLVFGLAHLGEDFVGSPLPVVAAVAVGGIVAGLVVRRTGSLFLPIVVHICFDVPLYFALVCREG